MSFNVYFSDPTKAATPIVVEDGKPGQPGNTVDTSLTLLGKNASGYAKSIATNFVQLLENFASPDPPTNPIEGQIWYDNDTKRLRINDSTAGGANWKPLNGVYQQSNEPDTALAGDLWIDTSRNQVFMTSDGVAWTLVGPNFSQTLKTGPYAETIKDKYGKDHTVIKNYINDTVIEVISPETFTPSTIISGFDNLEAGINLNSSYSTKLNASALSAENLLVTVPYTETVPGNSFVRNDISNTINASLNIQESLTIGINPTFILSKGNQGYINDFRNTFEGGQFSFKISNNNILTEILKIDGENKRVGINVGESSKPSADLHVKGDVLIEGQLSVGTPTVGLGLSISGPTIFSSSISVVGTSTLSTSTIRSLLTVGNSNDTLGTTIIAPAVTNIHNIGSSTKKFANIYATNFWGTVQGNLIGAATSLANTSTWQLGGQISGSLKRNNVVTSFKGESGIYIFDASLTSNAIDGQGTTESSSATDHLIISTAGMNDGISKITKADFLSDIYGSIVPPGTILPWAGVDPTGKDGTNGIPNNLRKDLTLNWLLCDGSIVDSADYPELFKAIRYTYGRVPEYISQFKLPDMRGRMAIGYDNMSNDIPGSSPNTAAGRVPEAAQPGGKLGQYNNSLNPNVYVNGGSYAATTSTVSGSVQATSGSPSVQSVMNPYYAFNFIIKT